MIVEEIPIGIISDRSLSPLESIALFLKEQGLTNHQIALGVGRDDRTIWTVLNRANKKRQSSQKPILSVSDILIPINLLHDRSVSALEAISNHLFNKGYTYHQIAKFLQRDDRTIWTCVNRYKKKKLLRGDD